MNEIYISGRLGKDPQLSYTQSGTPFCRFSLCVEMGNKNNPQPMWFQVVAWERTAEACAKYLTKGRGAVVTGPLFQRQYTDQQGQLHEFLEVRARKVEFMGSPQQNQYQQEYNQQAYATQSTYQYDNAPSETFYAPPNQQQPQPQQQAYTSQPVQQPAPQVHAAPASTLKAQQPMQPQQQAQQQPPAWGNGSEQQQLDQLPF